ncbi:MAG: heavy metal translocating P-type ATPase [Olsenella sp.]|nr:heavy metal translocating P-type ATPase [Olsenella sp.]
MFFNVVSEISGRMRLRCGALLFDEGEARGVALGLMGIEGVRSAEVHPANGSILIVFDPASREAVLAFVRELDPLDLPSAAPGVDEASNAIELAAEKNRFVGEVGRIVLAKIARRILLPLPLRNAWVVFQAIRFLVEGLRHLVRGELTVEVLDATAICASVLRGSFSDADAVIFLLQLSDVIERHVQSRTHLALMGNMVTRAESVWAVIDGEDVRIPVDDVEKGMVLHVGMGSALPADGEVVEGEAEIDESSMTGESLLVHKEAGSTVYAGTAIESGDLRVRVIAPPGAARIDKIVSLVEESSDLKAEAQGKAERLADALVPYSFLAFFGILAITRSMAKAMILLMVDYSCAIRFSTPVAVMSAMNEATRRNMVVKGGKYLEALAEADTIVFDKTGTLTRACPQVERVLSFGDKGEDEVLRYAACIEEHFPHSVARAIVEEARRRGLLHERELHADVEYIVAHGISTKVDGLDVCIGSGHFVFEDEGVPCPEGLLERIEAEHPASSVIFMASDHELMGAICVRDPIREEAQGVLRKLREHGISQIVMLTGDSEACARHVAEQLGIDAYHAQVLPEDKSRYVQELRAQGHRVIMVGDGINDSPALAAADVSVAMSDASDIARAVADVSVLDASLESLVRARRLSEGLMRRIRNDYNFIVAFNSSLIAFGVAGVMPVTTAAYLHNGSTFAVTALNARPLLRD